MVYSCRMLLHKGRGIMLFMFSITTSFVLSSGDQYFGKFFFLYDINCFPISTKRIFYLLYFIRNHYQSCLTNAPLVFFYISEIEYQGFHVRKKSKTTLLVPFYMYSIPIPGWTCIIRKWNHYIWYTCTSWFTYKDKKDSFSMG